MKLKKLEMQAFKSYVNKEDGTFDFEVKGNPANFVSIYAPNGFGKTTLYDAIDYCLTNTIHRYVREKSIERMNESQAKSMNKPGSKQHILRSKNAPDELESRVTLYTSKKVFDRTIPTSRNNSKDFKFSDKDTIDEYRYFRDVLLSQEAIDAFLRENTPEQRYEKFVENQLGGSVEHESDRKQIVSSLDHVQQDVKVLAKQKETNRQKLIDIETSDISINDLTELRNKVSNYFDGVPQFPEEITSFNRDILNECDIFVEVHKTELSKSSEKLQEKKQTTTQILSSFDELVSGHSLHQKLTLSEISLKEQKQELEKLPALELEQSSLATKTRKIQSFLRSIESFKLHLPAYVKNRSEQNTLKIQKVSIEDQIVGEQKKLDLLNRDLNGAQNKKGELVEKLDFVQIAVKNSSSIYKELNELTSSNLKAEEEVSLSRNTISKNEHSVRKLKKELEVFSGKTAEIARNQNIYSMIEDLDLATKYEELSGIYLKYTREYEAAKLRSSSLNEYKSSFAELIELGLNIIGKESTDVCPLCSKEYKDHETLKKKVLENDFLRDTEKDIFSLLEHLQKQLSNVEDELNVVYSRLRNERQAQLDKLLADSERSEKIIIESNGRIEGNIAKINKLRESVFNKEQSAFESYCSSVTSMYSSELKEIGQRELQLIADIEKSNELILKLEAKALEHNIKLQGFSSTEHKEFESFLQSNNLSELDPLSTLKEKLEELESRNFADLREVQIKLESNSASMNEVRSKVDIDKEVGNKEILDLVSTKYLDVINEKDVIAKTVSKLVSYVFDLGFEKLLVDGAYKLLKKEIEKKLSKQDEDHNQNSELDRILTEFGIQVRHGVERSESLSLIEENKKIEDKLSKYQEITRCLESDLKLVNTYIKSCLDNYFQTDLINQIYSKIDPHPDFKKIRFDCEIKEKGKPKLNVYITNEDGEDLAPNISFSSAQINVLSLSIFLARALNTKDESGNNVECILIDDPVQSMDAINVLGVIDLLRNLSFNLDKQIIVSTHDDNFHELLMQKIPPNIYRSKFFELESFGKVSHKDKFINFEEREISADM